ncbi:MAG: zf-HC2 domain-containing protein [Pseudonocardiales bacterium]
MSESDGAYLLGALSPEDRRAYEDHLAGCPACSAALAEVAGLPGLLGRVPADAVDVQEPLPADVLPHLLAAVQVERTRSRRRFRVALGALATAAAVVATALIAPGLLSSHRQPTQLAFAPVGEVPITATAAVIAKKWGTEIDLRCTYEGTSEWGSQPYSLVATDRLGHEEEIATWTAAAGKPVTLVASTFLQRKDLATLEVRLPTGRPVLRLRT